MTRVKYLVMMLLLVMAAACGEVRQAPAPAAPDTPENRTAAAKRYLEAMPPGEMLHELSANVAQRLPEERRKAFLDVMGSKELAEATYRISLEALVKHFTVGELNALTAFYGAPEGKSAKNKFGPYMAEIMPQINQEVMKALQPAQKEPPPGKPAPPPQAGQEPPQKPPQPPEQPAKKEPPLPKEQPSGQPGAKEPKGK